MYRYRKENNANVYYLTKIMFLFRHIALFEKNVFLCRKMLSNSDKIISKLEYVITKMK